jgi:hypothetical protein
MGYRAWYLVARAAHNLRKDPAAVGLVFGFAAAVLRRAPRLGDARARAVLRDDQSLRNIVQRRREALGRGAARPRSDRAPMR